MGRHSRPSWFRRPTTARLGWGVADQAVSSLENFLVGVLVARTIGSESLGVLGLTLLASALTVTISRGMSTDPLLVRFSGAPTPRWRTAAGVVVGTALVAGVVGSLVCALIAATVRWSGGSTELSDAMFALALVLPGLTAQDSWRYVYFSAGQGAKTFANDLVWTVLLFAALLAVPAARASVAGVVLAYGASAAVAAVIGAFQGRILPRFGGVVEWLRAHRDLGLRFVGENVTLGAGGQVRSIVVAATAGLVGVGAIRGGEMLVGPVVALLMGIAQVAVPEAVRWRTRGRAAFTRLCVIVSLGLASSSLLWGLVIVFAFPFGPGRLVLGPVWPSTHPLLFPLALAAVFGGLMIGPSTGLRALGRADLTLRSQVTVSVLAVLLSGGGGLFWNAAGAVWGSAVAAGIGALVWWSALVAGMARHRWSPATDGHPATEGHPARAGDEVAPAEPGGSSGRVSPAAAPRPAGTATTTDGRWS